MNFLNILELLIPNFILFHESFVFYFIRNTDGINQFKEKVFLGILDPLIRIKTNYANLKRITRIGILEFGIWNLALIPVLLPLWHYQTTTFSKN